MTASAFGILVDEGKVSWNSLVRDVYPEFRQASETVGRQAALADLLVYRTGLARKNLYWHQSCQKLLLPKDETASTLSLLKEVAPFRAAFVYNNWAYCFAGIILERIAGETFGSFIQRDVFQPLGLSRTTIGIPAQENLAESYQTLDNGIPWWVPRPEIHDETIMRSAGGAKSSVNDLLRYSTSFLAAAKHQVEIVVLRQVFELARQQISISSSSSQSGSYALELVVTELPLTLGAVVVNPRELGQDMPVIKRSTKCKKCVWYHNGCLPGALAAAYLLPDTETVIIVLSNSVGRRTHQTGFANFLSKVS